MLSKEIHKQINLSWLINNNFIKVNQPITDEYMQQFV